MPRKTDTDRADGTAAVNGFSDVARQRREQVIEAAIEIIATEGIHRLSLGNIEERVKMARGHLTYYFPSKEDILLAVFDRMLDRMITEGMKADGPKPGTGRAFDCARSAVEKAMEPAGPEKLAFLSLINTFLAQTPYRDDFRKKIAGAHAGWRDHLAADYAGSVERPPVPPEIAASLVMALVQGLGGQLAVDPAAFDRTKMLAAVQTLLAPLFGITPPQGDRP
jgi:AcrR family transcriptional regulator